MKQQLNKYFQQGISFETYLKNAERVNNSEEEVEYKEYYEINLKRMERIAKQIEKGIIEWDFKNQLEGHKMLIISEGWCGDAAQIIPFAHYLSNLHQIDLRIVYRDKNLDLMDNFLTNGGRAIPVIIALDKEGQYINHFAPRPKDAQDLMVSMKEQGIEKKDINLALQKWYNKDKGRKILEDIFNLYPNKPI